MKMDLIVPLAADRLEYEDMMPYIFNFDDNGMLLCVNAISGLDLTRFDNIYFTILHKHDKLYSLKELLELQFKRISLKKAKVIVLEKETSCQAETVYATIIKENIKGGIFVKDADGYFKCDYTQNNGIVIYPLDKLNIVDPHNKSYVEVDDQFYITNIIEKKIIGRYFNAGGYIFEKSSQFCEYFERLRHYGSLYMSHIVYSMLLDNISFRPFEAENYKDWGNKEIYKLLG